MRSVIGALRASEPDKFNDEVHDAVSQLLPDARVSSRVKQIGGERLERDNGETIGDVDVLAVVHGIRTVLAIEVKDLSLARNVHEMASESETLLVGSKSTMVHHGERVQWLVDHLELVVVTAGFVWKKGKWKVKPLVVTSHELMSPRFQAAPIEIVSLRSLPLKLRALGKT